MKKIKLHPEQHRIIRTFIHYFGEQALDWTPYMMEMFVVMCFMGEPELIMTDKEWDLYDEYLKKWNIRKPEKEEENGQNIYEPAHLYRLASPIRDRKPAGQKKRELDKQLLPIRKMDS